MHFYAAHNAGYSSLLSFPVFWIQVFFSSLRSQTTLVCVFLESETASHISA
jgi:hypothetical protein